MGKILNEEIEYMKYLLGYKKGVVISEQQVPNPIAKNDNCVTISASGTFNATKADSTDHLSVIINELQTKIKNNEEFTKGGVVTNLRIIGGASNYKDGVTQFTMDNNYNVIPGAKITDTNSSTNLGYATARANAAKQPVLDELKKITNLTIQVEPKIESYIIDTGGKTDEVNKAEKSNLKPGQIVIIQATICPLKPEETGREETPQVERKKIYECFESATIEVNYEGSGHNCNNAVYEIFANGIKLTSRNGHEYASLNNLNGGDGGVPADKKRGYYRFNFFDLTIDGVNKNFFNSKNLYKYNGGLVVSAKCIPTVNATTGKKNGKWQGWRNQQGMPKSDCHAWVGDIKLKTSDGVETVNVAKTNLEGTGLEFSTPNDYDVVANIVGFEACKGAGSTDLTSK